MINTELIAVANLIRSLFPRRTGDQEPSHVVRQRENLILSLRRMYFAPDGVRGLLEDIAEGEDIEEDRAAQVLTEFNDAEHFRPRHLFGLADLDHFERPDLSLRQIETLRKIGWNKISVRKEVQMFLNFAERRPSRRAAERARELLDQVEALNAAIIDAEAAVREHRN